MRKAGKKSELREPEQRGRPRVHDESYRKVTVVLLDRHVINLDQLSVDIRKNNGAIVKRAELIRAMIDAVAESGVDLTHAASEGDVKAILASKLCG